MPKNEEKNQILKKLWEIDDKFRNGQNISDEEARFYNANLHVIKQYYKDNWLYWDGKQKLVLTHQN